MAGGRPIKYDKKYNEKVTKLCLLGATEDELADFFDISKATVTIWKKKYPEFLAAIKEGKVVADMAVTNSLYKEATKSGGNIMAKIYWLNNRRRQDWSNNQDNSDKEDKDDIIPPNKLSK